MAPSQKIKECMFLLKTRSFNMTWIMLNLFCAEQWLEP